MNLGDVLLHHGDEVVERWEEAWERSPHPHSERAGRGVKEMLPAQIECLGLQLIHLSRAEDPHELWKAPQRVDPEHRVGEGIPIAELVLAYKLLVDVVHSLVRRRGVRVSDREFAYFHDAVFELVAEAVSRYSAFQAELVARERSEYLAGVTHQMRSPLSALSFAMQIIDQSQEVTPAVLDAIRRNVHRLQVLIDSVMRLERFKPHELPVRPTQVQPARIIDEVVNDHHSRAVEKDLRFVVHANRTLTMTIDPELFRDAIGNLIDNAIKYTTSGFVRVEVEEHEENVTFLVIDSGPGIPEARRAALFAPVCPGKGGGLGIGLAIVARAVAAQGGEVGVESEEGVGSTFWFRLPREVEQRNVDG